MDLSKSRTLKQRKRRISPRYVPIQAQPVEIDFAKPGTPARVAYSDGFHDVATCLHCERPPCLEYSEGELSSNQFSTFPQDPITRVCPSEAITWPEEASAPVVNPELCFSCGLCIRRCVTGAIYFGEDSTAIVNDAPSARVIDIEADDSRPVSLETVEAFSLIPKSGPILLESDEAILGAINKLVDGMRVGAGGQFPNLLVRNILKEMGYEALIRRVGDTSTRADLAFVSPNSRPGVAEVEVGGDALEAVRGALDNYAVAKARFGLEEADFLVVAVHLGLPARRVDYWNVVHDAKRVLGVCVQTLSIGALFLGMWAGKPLVLDTEAFYADAETYSIREAVEASLGRKAALSERAALALES